MEMKMQSIIFTVRVIVAVALCSSGWSLAIGATADETPSVVPTVSEVSVVQAASAVVSGLGVPIASSQLGDYRGGFDIVKNDMQLSGSVANNSAVNVMSGNNYIADGAFSNASGLPMVIQNSGSNVLIQNATIVNVQFQ
jgi:hypothetical protein